MNHQMAHLILQPCSDFNILFSTEAREFSLKGKGTLKWPSLLRPPSVSITVVYGNGLRGMM